MQPPLGKQLSSVHGLPSSQAVGSVTHSPALQLASVQSPLTQGAPSGSTLSTGHSGETPSHTSVASHSRKELRRTVFAATGVQSPLAEPPAATLQARQSPSPVPHADSQHTPSTHSPEAHCASATQAPP